MKHLQCNMLHQVTWFNELDEFILANLLMFSISDGYHNWLGGVITNSLLGFVLLVNALF